MAKADPEKIEIRSDEVQDILVQVPRWIIRWGILVILITVVLIIAGSWLFKYPDINRSKILITTENPPATLVAKVNGKIEKLFVEDNEFVEANRNLAVIESAADYADVLVLNEILLEVRNMVPKFDMLIQLELGSDYLLGEIQPTYARFLKVHKDYQDFVELDYYNQKINSMEGEVNQLNVHLSSLKKLTSILGRELDLVERQYLRDSSLFQSNVISEAEYEKAKTSWLNKEFDFEQSRVNESNTEILIEKLKQDVLDMELKYTEDLRNQQNNWQESLENLIAAVSIWKQKFMLTASIDGVVTFTAYYSENQNVREGDKVMTIIPKDQGKIIGRINLSVEGAGKVELDQRVNIQIDNYPYLEYGMVRGIVSNISLVPDDREYMVEVNLPNGLSTLYDIEIPFDQEMQGKAEILTDNRRLLERIISPIRSAISKQRGISES
ncbi:MAG: HlyD family efflux transporter periplasmic adaptor subunit [Bacteroidales bacterium]|nr:HlyD family efflux transporter periplasmic adaptor subunit [Bacteroidales bacterium]